MATLTYLVERGRSPAVARGVATGLLTWARVATTGHHDAVQALQLPLADSEDALQVSAARACRAITLYMAKAIAQKGGGVLGAWSAGIGITDLRGFVERTFEPIDAVGLDHVCMGTDMDANYKPVFDTYANLPCCVAGRKPDSGGRAATG